MSFVVLPRTLALFLGGLSLFFIFVPLAQAQSTSPDTLTLDTAIQQALANNPQAQMARNDETIASNNYSLGNAGLLPSLSTSAGYNKTISNTRQDFLSGEVQDQTGAHSSQRNAGAEMRWTLFDGLGRIATYRRLGAELSAQEASTRNEIASVVAEVIVTYHDVARQQRQLTVLREAVDVSEERLRIAETRRDVGSASDLDVRQARADLNADRAEALRQETTLAEARAELNRLLSRTSPSPFAVREQIDLSPDLSLEELDQMAEDQNPSLRQARQNERAAELERRELQAERLPSLDATLGYGFGQQEAESGFVQSSRSHDFQYGLSLTFNIFDGFNRQRRRQNAEMRARTAELAVEDVSNQLQARLSSARESYQNQMELVELERQNLDDAQANVEIALRQFELGTITSIELREVQEQLIRAESRLITAEFEAKRAEVELLQLSGQLLDRF